MPFANACLGKNCQCSKDQLPSLGVFHVSTFTLKARTNRTNITYNYINKSKSKPKHNYISKPNSNLHQIRRPRACSSGDDAWSKSKKATAVHFAGKESTSNGIHSVCVYINIIYIYVYIYIMHIYLYVHAYIQCIRDNPDGLILDMSGIPKGPGHTQDPSAWANHLLGLESCTKASERHAPAVHFLTS